MKSTVSVLAVASLVTAPAGASVRDAAFATGADRARAETGVFIGVNHKVTFGRRANAREVRTSFNIAPMVRASDAQYRIGEGLGFAPAANGKATFLIGGQPIDTKDKANLSTAGTVSIVVVGVLAVGAVAAYYALRDPCDHKECE